MQPAPTTCLQVPTYRPLLWVALAMMTGIVADRYVGSVLGSVGLYGWWSLALSCVLATYFSLRSNSPRLSAWFLLGSFAALSGAWHHECWNYLGDSHLARFAETRSEPICVRAVALGRAQWTPAPKANPLRVVPEGSRSVIPVSLTAVRDGSDWIRTSGRCNLRVEGKLAKIQRGDQLELFGQFGRPRPAINPGQYEWAEAERGAGRFVELFCRMPQCVTVEQVTAFQPTSFLDRATRWCEYQITKYVDAEQRDLALALMLGQRERLTEEKFASFLHTGTVHLLVVSGLHVGFLATILWLFVRAGILAPRTALAASTVLIVAYALIVGARPPVLRATILILVAMTSVFLGRRSTRANLIAVAAMIVLAINPGELFRGGTQLSFLCVSAIAWFLGFAERRHTFDPLADLIETYKPWQQKLLESCRTWFVQLVLISLVIWLVTAPLVAYHFHMAAPVSVLLTPMIWLLVAIALVAEFALCIVGWVLPPVGYVLGSLISFCLAVTESCVEFAAGWEIGHFFTAGPAAWWLLGLYALLGIIALLANRSIDWKWQLAAVAMWISVGFGASSLRMKKSQLQCTFLAIGHGTCVVVELPGGQTLLYDAGSLGSPEGASRSIASFLWSQGISRIDAVVLSHADIDHYNAIPDLLDRVPIETVYVSPLMFDPWATQGQLTAPNYLKETLVAADVPIEEVWMNDNLATASTDVSIEVLHPPRTGVAGRDNANSIMLCIRYAGQTILLPGDLESPGIEAVMAEPALDCNILLAPHHGSVRSDPPGFAAWCTPEWVVVSGRNTNGRDDFTAESYRALGAEVRHTSDCGATSFVISPDTFQVSTYLNPGNPPR